MESKDHAKTELTKSDLYFKAREKKGPFLMTNGSIY